MTSGGNTSITRCREATTPHNQHRVRFPQWPTLLPSAVPVRLHCPWSNRTQPCASGTRTGCASKTASPNRVTHQPACVLQHPCSYHVVQHDVAFPSGRVSGGECVHSVGCNVTRGSTILRHATTRIPGRDVHQPCVHQLRGVSSAGGKGIGSNAACRTFTNDSLASLTGIFAMLMRKKSNTNRCNRSSVGVTLTGV
jgi:hypothetical protein